MKTITEAILNRKIITEFTPEELIEFAYGCFYRERSNSYANSLDIKKSLEISIKNKWASIKIKQPWDLHFDAEKWEEIPGLPTQINFSANPIKGLSIYLEGNLDNLTLNFPSKMEYKRNDVFFRKEYPVNASTTINGNFSIILKDESQPVPYASIIDTSGNENYDIHKQFGWKGRGDQRISINNLVPEDKVEELSKKYPQFIFSSK